MKNQKVVVACFAALSLYSPGHKENHKKSLSGLPIPPTILTLCLPHTDPEHLSLPHPTQQKLILGIVLCKTLTNFLRLCSVCVKN
jgi:hypothetical protein